FRGCHFDELRRPRTLDQLRGLHRVGRAGAVGRAVAGQRARAARRLAGVADPPAVEDDPVREHRPLTTLDQRPDRVLDLHRGDLAGPLPPADQPGEVRVDGEAGNVEGVAEDDVRRLAPDPGQLDQVGQAAGYMTVVALDQGLTQLDQ